MKIEVTFNDAQIELLESIPMLIQYAVADKCMKAMVKPIAERAKDVLPSSRSTGTRKKWSKKYKQNAAWQINSGRHVGAKVVKYQRGATAYVGPTYPKGNKQQFNSNKERGRRVFYWGKNAGQVYIPDERPMQRAYDETRDAQMTAFMTTLTNEIAEIARG